MSTFVSTAEPIVGRSKITRLFALLVGFAVLCFGVVVAGASPAHAAGQTVSGTIAFPVGAPDEVRVAANPNDPWDEDRAGVYLALDKDQEGTVEGWELGVDDNVNYDPATGAWSVTDVPNGAYRLSIYVWLPGNGSAAGTYQNVTVSNADVPIGTTTITETGRLRPTIGLCGWQQGDETSHFIENVDTDTIYRLEPAQSGDSYPVALCDPAPSDGVGNWMVPESGIAAGDYIAYTVWNGNTHYYTDDDSLASADVNDAGVFPVQLWEGQSFTSIVPAQVSAGELTVSGTPTVGATLTANATGWTADAEIGYQWLRGSTPISGATSQTYVLTTTDADQQISVKATGTKVHHESKTKQSTAVTVGKGAFTSTPVPTISGTATFPNTLTANPGTWAPAVAAGDFKYQWLRAGAPISGATGKTYALAAADAGASLTVQVTGTKAGYNDAAVTSEPVSVKAGTLTPGTPVLSGTAKVGEKLSVAVGTWAPGEVATSVKWLSDGEVVDGAAGDDYVVAAADLGRVISAEVTGSKAGYTSAKKVVASDEVAAGTLESVTPTISGTAKVGSTLTAKPGTWTPAADKFTYQWQRNGKAISGATSATLALKEADTGAQISVEVTGAKAGYTTVTKTSAKTAKVEKGVYTPPTKSPFNDVANSYKFYEPIAWMYTEGLSTGVKTGDGRDYQPKVGVSREAMAAFLYRLEGANYKGPKVSPFADIQPGEKFYNEIAWMHKTGLSTGVKQAAGKPNYAPKAKVSREAMAAFIYRLEEATTAAPKVSPFADMQQGDKFYKEIAWMSTEGLSTGIRQPSGLPIYAPKASVSREAMAAFLYRLETN